MHVNRNIDYNDRTRWLALMQHHGLPTRLMDWSRSPLVAAYFALERYLPQFFQEFQPPDQSAAVWLLNPYGLNEHTCPAEKGTVGAIESGTHDRLTTEAFYPYLERRQRPAPRMSPPVYAATSVETDMRMFAQQGCFTIHGAECPALEDIEELDPYLLKVVIPADAVPKFAEELDACGMREGDIYPDLDHLSAELVRNSPIPYAWSESIKRASLTHRRQISR
jgi:hypothetical protein